MNQGMFEALLAELRQMNERLRNIEVALTTPPVETTLEVIAPEQPKPAKRSKAA